MSVSFLKGSAPISFSCFCMSQARLKMEKGSSSSCREKNVLRVVDNLLLSHRMNVKLESLSGGQKKRLALAIQVSKLLGSKLRINCDYLYIINKVNKRLCFFTSNTHASSGKFVLHLRLSFA